MDRTKKTALNAFAGGINLAIKAISSLILMHAVLEKLGSDYNGLNSTITQFITVFSLVSSSFTTASLVMLYAPYNESDWDGINAILSSSRHTYRVIGCWMLLLGSIAAFLYSNTILTSVPMLIVVGLLLLALLSSVFNVTFINVYRLMLQVSQTESIATFITSFYTAVSLPVSLWILHSTGNILLMRVSDVSLEIVSGLAISVVARRMFPPLDLSASFNMNLVKGTSNVFMSSLTGVVYRSAPTLFLSSLVGTSATSVYYVNESIVAMIRNIVTIVINAPRNAIGQIIHSKDIEKLRSIFEEYEYLTIGSASVLLGATSVLINPFIRLYTAGIPDADYSTGVVPALLICSAFIELSHIPSGLVLQLSGKFKLCRNIQFVALAVLILSIVLLGSSFGLIGVMVGVLLTASALATLEVLYAYKEVLLSTPDFYCRCLFSHTALTGLIFFLGIIYVPAAFSNYLQFITYGFVTLLISVILGAVFGKLLFPRYYAAAKQRIAALFNKR